MKATQDKQKSGKKLMPLGKATEQTKGNYGFFREGWEGGWRWGAEP